MSGLYIVYFIESIVDVIHFKAWLEKLCGEAIVGVENKRNRNIYLSNLVLCMQEGQLAPPFQISPAEADISNARQVFGLETPKVAVNLRDHNYFHHLKNYF